MSAVVKSLLFAWSLLSDQICHCAWKQRALFAACVVFLSQYCLLSAAWKMKNGKFQSETGGKSELGEPEALSSSSPRWDLQIELASLALAPLERSCRHVEALLYKEQFGDSSWPGLIPVRCNNPNIKTIDQVELNWSELAIRIILTTMAPTLWSKMNSCILRNNAKKFYISVFCCGLETCLCYFWRRY